MKEMVIPQRAEILSVEEMIEVNGGERYTYYLSNNDCKALCFAICGSVVGISYSALIATIDVAVITIAAFIPGMAGLTTAALGTVAFDFAKKMTEICLSNDKGLRIDYTYPMDIDFTITNNR